MHLRPVSAVNEVCDECQGHRRAKGGRADGEGADEGHAYGGHEKDGHTTSTHNGGALPVTLDYVHPRGKFMWN